MEVFMRRDINFFTVYHSQNDTGISEKFNIIALSFCAGCLIIILGIFSFLKLSDSAVIKNILSANSFLQSTQVMQAEQNLNNGNSKIAALSGYKKAAQEVTSEVSANPVTNSTLLQNISSMEPSDIAVSDISYSEGLMTLVCTCSNNKSPAIFVHTLEQSGDFDSVDYQDLSSGDGKTFAFSIAITLKGGDGE
jgi:hypothetical protein